MRRLEPRHVLLIPDHGFYAYGLLHETEDLLPERLAAALSSLLGDSLDEDALDTARGLLDQALWLADELRVRLPRGRRHASRDVKTAWRALVSEHAPRNHELLRALGHVHRLAVAVLKAIATGQGPYSALLGQGRHRSDIPSALASLEAGGPSTA